MTHVKKNDNYRIIHDRRSSKIPYNLPNAIPDKLPIIAGITSEPSVEDEEVFRQNILHILDTPVPRSPVSSK